MVIFNFRSYRLETHTHTHTERVFFKVLMAHEKRERKERDEKSIFQKHAPGTRVRTGWERSNTLFKTDSRTNGHLPL